MTLKYKKNKKNKKTKNKVNRKKTHKKLNKKLNKKLRRSKRYNKKYSRHLKGGVGNKEKSEEKSEEKPEKKPEEMSEERDEVRLSEQNIYTKDSPPSLIRQLSTPTPNKIKCLTYNIYGLSKINNEDKLNKLYELLKSHDIFGLQEGIFFEEIGCNDGIKLVTKLENDGFDISYGKITYQQNDLATSDTVSNIIGWAPPQLFFEDEHLNSELKKLLLYYSSPYVHTWKNIDENTYERMKETHMKDVRLFSTDSLARAEFARLGLNNIYFFNPNNNNKLEKKKDSYTYIEKIKSIINELSLINNTDIYTPFKNISLNEIIEKIENLDSNTPINKINDELTTQPIEFDDPYLFRMVDIIKDTKNRYWCPVNSWNDININEKLDKYLHIVEILGLKGPLFGSDKNTILEQIKSGYGTDKQQEFTKFTLRMPRQVDNTILGIKKTLTPEFINILSTNECPTTRKPIKALFMTKFTVAVGHGCGGGPDESNKSDPTQKLNAKKELFETLKPGKTDIYLLDMNVCSRFKYDEPHDKVGMKAFLFGDFEKNTINTYKHDETKAKILIKRYNSNYLNKITEIFDTINPTHSIFPNKDYTTKMEISGYTVHPVRNNESTKSNPDYILYNRVKFKINETETNISQIIHETNNDEPSLSDHRAVTVTLELNK